MGEKDKKQYYLKKTDGEYCPFTRIADISKSIESDQNDNLQNFSEDKSFSMNFEMNSNTKNRLFWTIVAPDKINRNNFRKNHGIPMIRRVAGRRGVRKYR